MHVGLMVVTVCYVLVTLVVGTWKFRGRDYADFVASPGRINKYAIALSMCGTVIGGGMFLAVAQMGYEAGFAVLALPLSYVLGYGLLTLAVPAIRSSMSSSEVNTLYDVIRVRLAGSGDWAQRYTRLLGLITCAMYFFMLAAQFTILANFYIGVLSVGATTAWLLSLGVIGGTTLIYTIAGGIRKDIATDVFQVPVVIIGVVVLAVSLAMGRGVSFSNVPETHWTFSGYGTAFPIAVLLFFSPAFVGRFDYWQRIIAAKSSGDARWALWMTLPIIVGAYVVFCLVGIAARSMFPSIDAPHAAVSFFRALPPAVCTFVTLSFYSALMASSDTLLNVSAVSLSSVLQTTSKRCRAAFRTLLAMRVLTVVVGVSASVTVLLAADTVDLIIGGFSSLVILTPGLLYTLLIRRPDARVSFASLIFGYATFIGVFFAAPALRKYAFAFGFVVACAVLGLALTIAWVSNRVWQGEARS